MSKKKFTDATGIKYLWKKINTKFNALLASISILDNEKLDASKLPEATNEALAQAKASGEFNGEQGYSVVATVDRPSFSTANWDTYGTIGRVENWGNTSNIGVRVGDIFLVCGTATDTGIGHLLVYKYTGDKGGSTLSGICLAHHLISAKGATGATPKFTIGTVSTLAEGSKATVTISGTTTDPVLNLGIPKGDTGTFDDSKLENYIEKTEIFNIEEIKSPEYTNQIPLSTDENDNIFGYIAESTIRGTGSVETDSTHSGYVTGYIPVKEGDVIRIKDPSQPNFPTTVSFGLYKYKGYEPPSGADIAKTVGTMVSNANNAFGEITIEGNVLTWKLVNLNVYYWKDFTYARIMTMSADSIVTVNEELTESVKEELILKPSVKVTKDSLDMELSDKPLYGKTIVGFGDSIFGYKRDSTSVLSHVANVTGATVHNVGFGGCRMSTHPTTGYAAFSMWKLADAVTTEKWDEQDEQASSGSSYFAEQVALLKTIDFNNVDIVIIHYGSNDYTGGSGIKIDNTENLYDCNTFIGAFRYSVEKLLTAFPHLQIYVSLPTYCKYSIGEPYPENHTNTLGKYVYEYIEALRGAATEYNLSVIDCFYGLGVNKFNVDTLTSDGAHHNNIGRKRLGEFIGGHLIGNQATVKSDSYSRKDIDAIMGSYVNDINTLLGGD